jgi:CBS domain-containing protein
MKIAEIMTRGALTCGPNDTLEAPARIMWENDCGCVPVVNAEGATIGMITDRDICMAAYTQGLALHQISVWSGCAHEVVAVVESDTIQTAEDLMRRHRVRRLPVVDDQRRPIGILSMNDLVRHLKARGNSGLSPESIARTLASVSEHTVTP